jgi:Icc-related predicted phosphoesterase
MMHCYQEAVMPDIFIYCGDATNYGTPGEMERVGIQLAAVKELGCDVVFVPGNHDFLCERQAQLAHDILMERVPGIFLPKPFETIEVRGRKIFCTPHVPPCGNWAFCLPEDKFADGIEAYFPKEGVDIVATHSPPKGILDTLKNPILKEGYGERELGYGALLKILDKTDLMLCGHIHQHGGKCEKWHKPGKPTTIINCAGVPMLHTIK